MPIGGGFVRYSPLCNTDREAYKWYCAASYGAGIEWFGGEFRGEGDAGCGRSGVDDGRDVGLDARREAVSRRWNALLLDMAGGAVGSGGAGSRGIGYGDEGAGAAGVSSGGSRDCGRGFVGHGGDASVKRESGQQSQESVADASVVEESGRERGKHWKRNQRKAAKRREKVKVGSDVPEWRRKNGVKQVVGEKTELQVSLEAKWKAENELKVLEAQRKIELLKKQDVDAIAKCNARKLQAASEKAMVQMEKAHATLVATGNVPGEVALGGTAHTVVDGEIVPSLTNSCSISPNSSISEREVREMMKALEDEKKKNAELEERMKFMKLDHKLERFGDQCAVTMTCDSEGELPEGREELLEQIVRANNGREEDRVYKKDYFKKKIVNVKVQQYRQLGMDEYVGAFDY